MEEHYRFHEFHSRCWRTLSWTLSPCCVSWASTSGRDHLHRSTWLSRTSQGCGRAEYTTYFFVTIMRSLTTQWCPATSLSPSWARGAHSEAQRLWQQIPEQVHVCPAAQPSFGPHMHHPHSQCPLSGEKQCISRDYDFAEVLEFAQVHRVCHLHNSALCYPSAPLTPRSPHL